MLISGYMFAGQSTITKNVTIKFIVRVGSPMRYMDRLFTGNGMEVNNKKSMQRTSCNEFIRLSRLSRKLHNL